MLKNRFFYVLVFIVAIVLLIMVVFSSKDRGGSDKRIMVTTSFYPIYFMTSQIGGDLVRVENLVPNGVEPHDYELTPGDVIKIRKSELFFINGGGVELWEGDILSNIDIYKKSTVLIDEVADKRIENDPHIWLSPNLVSEMAEKIYYQLSKLDPNNANYYKSNLDTFRVKLFELDNEFKSGLKNCKKRDIITSHEAFGYLVRDYGLRQISIAGLSAEEEPALEKMVEIADFAKSNNVKYIFFESLLSPELSETIASEIGAQTLVLNPLEGLTEEELALGGDYFTEMQKNLENLKIALECN